MGYHSPEAYSYPIEVSFQGRGRSYTWKVHYSGSSKNGFLGMPGYKDLTDRIVPELYMNTYPYRDEAMSRARVTMTLNQQRTFLMLARDENMDYVGYGVFPRLLVGTNYVMYSSRAFIEEHEGQGLGTDGLNLAMGLHNEDLRRSHQKLVYGALYTGNPVSLASVVRANNTDNIRPLRKQLEDEDLRKGGGSYQMLSVPIQVVKAIHAQFLPNTTELNNITGVCRGELWGLGPNRSYVAGRSALVDKIRDEMVSRNRLNMNLDQGDVVIVVYDIDAAAGIEELTQRLAA